MNHSIILRNNLMITQMLLEEEEPEDQEIEIIIQNKKRKPTKPMFLAREQEGFSKNLLKDILKTINNYFENFSD